MPRVAVVGAGISGLAAAELLRDGAEITVLEAGDQPGGNIRSERVGDCIFERAANGFLDSEPAMNALVRRVGLEEQLLPATGGTRYLYLRGRMRPIPTKPPALLASSLLSPWAKARLLLEPLMPAGPDDETVARFVSRRIGRQPLRRMVGPMVSGIFGGDPEQLSLPACFPKMKAMEREHGSLLAAMRARRASAEAAAGPAGHLHSFRGGMGTLTGRLAERQVDLRLRSPVRALERLERGWRLRTPGGAIDAEAVVLACPAPIASALLAEHDRPLAAALDAIPYAPIAVVVTAFDRAGWRPPQGFGCLVPRGQGLRTLGTLFTSSIFPEHAPGGAVVLRTMIGGATDPEAIELDPQLLVGLALEEGAHLLGQELPRPMETRVYTYPRGIPQYTLGHLDRVAAVRAAERRLPGLFVTGNYLEGVGVKDCAAAAARLSPRVLAALGAGA